MDTAQFGRTFEDRSHVFIIENRDKIFEGGKLHVVQVKGKRGNRVQVYPAVEYAFVPNNLTINQNDMVHFQWTGSNSHNNGHPAGDGQDGDDGEGKGGTDRSNIVGLKSLNQNYPALSTDAKGLCENIKEVVWSKYAVHPHDKDTAKVDACIQLMSSGYYQCVEPRQDCNRESLQRKDKLRSDLNNAPASFLGVVLKFNKGVYHYFSTRNNNFPIREQKATLRVV